MKNLLFLIILFSASVHLSAQTQQIFNALNAGDAVALGRFFDESVEVIIERDHEVVHSRVATLYVSRFFEKAGVISCKEVHQGAAKGNSAKYTIGQLSTKQGDYRVYLYLTQSGNKTLIQEIRFDKM
jgi:hypothetical protein